MADDYVDDCGGPVGDDEAASVCAGGEDSAGEDVTLGFVVTGEGRIVVPELAV